MKKRAALYPYNYHVTPLVRYRQFIQKYDLVSVVAPKGLSLAGKDASVADEGLFIGINVTDDLLSVLDDVDVLIVAEYELDSVPDFKYRVLNGILDAMKRGKDIYCLQRFDDPTVCFLNQYAQGCRVQFFYELHEDRVESESAISIINTVSTPVVCTIGVSETSCKFEVQLAMRKVFESMGYSVSQVLSKNYGKILGAHAFPQFMFERGHTEEEKILAFNQFVGKIEREENPDIILLGIPGGFLPINENNPNHYCILPTEVTQAIPIDYMVATILEEQVLEKSLREMNNILHYKYGAVHTSFAVSNTRLNMNSLIDISFEKFVFDILSPKDCTDLPCKPEKLQPPFYWIHSEVQMKSLCEEIETILSWNYENQSAGYRMEGRLR